MLTIFTPTYNRETTLERLYEGLLKQTVKDFEWLVVDDGSTDNTREKIEQWMADGQIFIRYFYQENAGKMQAFNLGVKNAKGEFFMCLDSDDLLLENSVEEVMKCIERQENWSGLCGIMAYKGDLAGKPLGGDVFPKVKRDTLEGLYEKGFCRDTTLVFITKILANYPFPKIPGEKFITEGYMYDQIERNYQFLIVPKVLQLCEYQEDGYTSNRLQLKFAAPRGWQLFYNQKIGVRKGFKNKYVMAGSYDWCCLIEGCPRKMFTSNHRFWTIFAIPLGIRYYLKYRKVGEQWKN